MSGNSNDAGVGEFSGELWGRSGHTFYRESAKELTIYREMMVRAESDGSRSYGIAVTCDFRYWSAPKGEAISEQGQVGLLRGLREWPHSRGKQTNIDLPNDLTEEPRPCLWKGCHRNRLRNRYYCEHHFDVSCLAAIR